MGTDTNKYVFYGHTAFVSALAQQHLAEEEQYKQNYNRLEIRNENNKIKVPKETNKTEDPFPWLDKNDPRRQMTDKEILHKKILLNDSILNGKEKEELMQMLLSNRDAFSLRDEIGTCPYFEV